MSHPFDTVVVPTNDSRHARRAAEHGLSLAEQFDADVHVVSVVDEQNVVDLTESNGERSSYRERLESRANDAIAAVESTTDRPVETAVLYGEPSQSIRDYTREHDADLVTVGTHSREMTDDRNVTGSVTETLVRLCDMPVLTARATPRSLREGQYGEILVPTDGSRPATAAADAALAIADREDARVHVVSVVDSADIDPGATRLIERLESRAERAADELLDRVEGAGIEAVSEVLSGPPAAALLRYAADHDVDLLAMGTAGGAGVNRYRIGHTTERVVRAAPMPVLTVNPRDQQRRE